MYSGGSASGPLPILLFPQLAASGWLLRSRIAFFHAALASSVLIAVDSWRLIDGLIPGPQILQTGLIGFGYFATVGVALALGPLHQGQRGAGRAARHRRRQPRAGQPPDHPGHAGRRAGGRPQRRRPRPQRAGDAPARRLRAHARRHAPGRVQLDPARLLATLAGGLRRAAAAVQGRGDAAAAARAPGAHRLRAQRRHADLPRGPGPRAERGAADQARGDGPADREHRPRSAQSAVGDQPGGATARGGRLGRARGPAPAVDDPQQRQAHRPHRRRGAAAQSPRPPAARGHDARRIRRTRWSRKSSRPSAFRRAAW